MDIGGIVLVWRFGVPAPLGESWHNHAILFRRGKSTPGQAKFNKTISIEGGWLILTEFGIQIIAIWI